MLSTSEKESSSQVTGKRSGSGLVRALGLCSGGLDSMLSAIVLKEQGIEVVWINFETPFFSSEKARKASRITGIPLIVRNITDVYIEMLKNPNCGYGKNMNPCLDCHALMLRTAGSLMREKGFDFLFTGEVLGQRPMSQTKPSLRYVEKQSGFAGYILRPLSAKLLAPTIPEESGMVDRERLLALSGRSRKPQIQLAKSFGIRDYPAPAGGCLLTDVGFSRRLKDLLDHEDDCQERDYHLLKHGRHFRLNDKYKAIVGRTENDNRHISRLIDLHKHIKLRMMDIPGPTVVIPANAPDDILHEAAALCATYSKAAEGEHTRVFVTGPGGSKIITAVTGSTDKYHPYIL